MFIERKQLKLYSFPAEKVVRLSSSCGDIQMTFPGFPPQRCGAHLVALNRDNKLLIVAGFYLSETCESIFYVPEDGEVESGDIEDAFDEGVQFVESMGFVLNETDYHLLPEANKKKVWASVSICQTEEQKQAKLTALKEKAERQANQDQKQEQDQKPPATEEIIASLAEEGPADNEAVPQHQVTEKNEVPSDPLDVYRERSLKSLGRFLASM